MGIMGRESGLDTVRQRQWRVNPQRCEPVWKGACNANYGRPSQRVGYQSGTRASAAGLFCRAAQLELRRQRCPGCLLSKFVARHRAAVWTGAVAALGLATALGATLLQGRLAAALGVAVLAVASVLALLLALLQARRAATARDAATRASDEARTQLDRVKRITTELVFRYGDTVTHMPGGAQAQEAMLRNIVTLLEPTVQGSADDLDLLATMASVLGRLAEIQGNVVMAASERAGEATATAERALALRAWQRPRWPGKPCRRWRATKANKASGRGRPRAASSARSTAGRCWPTAGHATPSRCSNRR